MIFNRLLSSLAAHGLVDWSWTALDGSNIRALRCAAGAQKKHPDITGDNGLGRSRGGLGTKIHMATDASGLPLNIVLSPGQAHESQFALRLLDGMGVQRQNGSMKRRGHAVLAGKAGLHPPVLPEAMQLRDTAWGRTTSMNAACVFAVPNHPGSEGEAG